MPHPDPKTRWFALFDVIYERTSSPVSRLPCLEYCPECLCEKQENEKIYFLPYEMEFIQERTGIDLLATGMFWQISIPAALTNESESDDPIVFGFKGKLHSCPYLGDRNQCTIHEHRPLDCRSFPLMPAFVDGQLQFELESYCPLVSKLGSRLARFIVLYERIWNSLFSVLPDYWKHFYWNSSELLSELNDPNLKPKRMEVSWARDRVAYQSQAEESGTINPGETT